MTTEREALARIAEIEAELDSRRTPSERQAAMAVAAGQPTPNPTTKGE